MSFALNQFTGFASAVTGVAIPAATVDWNFIITQSLADASATYTLAHTRNAVGATFFDSAGTVTDAAANVARFGYHPDSLASLGLLVEADHINQANHSEQVTNGATWSTNEITATQDSGVFIDGNTVAEKIKPSTVSTTHWIRGSNVNALSAGIHITHGIHAKADGEDFIMMEATDGTNVFKMWVDLTDGTVGDTSGSAESYGVEKLQNDWYFVWAHTITVSTNNTRTKIYISSGSSSGDETFAGDAIKGVLLCGAHRHKEGGRSVGHYRGPTAGGDISQLDDDVDITPISGFFNASEGTLVLEFFQLPQMAQWNNFGVGFVNSGDSGNDFIWLYNSPHVTQYNTLIKDGGATEMQATPTGPGIGVGGYSKIALAYKANDCQLVYDGTADTVDSSVTLPSGLDTLKLGRAWNDTYRTGMYVQRLRYWDTRLTAEQMKALTNP